MKKQFVIGNRRKDSGLKRATKFVTDSKTKINQFINLFLFHSYKN